MYEIEIKWDGPFTVQEVIKNMKDGGEAPDYDGDDYGLYQIYGEHVLNGKDTLLYIGQATQQTFSMRLAQHKKDWMLKEKNKGKNITVYLGRIYDPKEHTNKNAWNTWKTDVLDAESALIYIYSPNYNSSGVASPPELEYKEVRLIHTGTRGALLGEDVVPRDFSC